MTSKSVIKALKISNINVEDIKVGPKKTNKKIPISLADKPLVFQTPFFEISNIPAKTDYPNIFQLDTLFKGDSKRKIESWFKFVDTLENYISNQVTNNGSKWFTQKQVQIKSLIREPEKNVFFMRWLVDLKVCTFVDEKSKQFDPSKLKHNDLIKLIVEIPELWIDNSACRLAVIVQKILVKTPTEKIYNEYVFDDSDTDNSDSENDDRQNIISLLATEQNSGTPVESSKYNSIQKYHLGKSYNRLKSKKSNNFSDEKIELKTKSNFDQYANEINDDDLEF
jgi:hypothetical protein